MKPDLHGETRASILAETLHTYKWQRGRKAYQDLLRVLFASSPVILLPTGKEVL